MLGVAIAQARTTLLQRGYSDADANSVAKFIDFPNKAMPTKPNDFTTLVWKNIL